MSSERNLYTGSLSTSLTTLYTVPPGKRASILNIDITTNGAATLPIFVYAVPSGGTAGAANVLLDNFVIPAGDTSTGNIFPWRGCKILENEGDTIQAYKTGVAASCIHISGLERVVTVDTLVS